MTHVFHTDKQGPVGRLVALLNPPVLARQSATSAPSLAMTHPPFRWVPARRPGQRL